MRKAFVERAADAIENKALGRALDANADRRQHGRHLAFASLPDVESRIQKAHARRLETIHRLDFYLDQFSRSLTAHGVQVHYAPDAAVASRLVLQITQRAGAKRVVKSKSMLSEEIQLNHTLEEHGLEVVETDLGEFIVQLRGETPGHIITPAIHLTRQDVARTFNEKLAMPYSEDVADLNKHARKTLRQVFLQADLGISGVNFGVADTGTLCLVTNEGNGRMVTSLPPVHIALTGVERIVPTAQDLNLMLQLLPRSATGQKLTSYISLLGSSRQNLKTNGSVERHVILVDNGRRSLVATPLEDALLCIRCGACLNACPVFREIGGHAYGSVYPGPIGSRSCFDAVWSMQRSLPGWDRPDDIAPAYAPDVPRGKTRSARLAPRYQALHMVGNEYEAVSCRAALCRSAFTNAAKTRRLDSQIAATARRLDFNQGLPTVRHPCRECRCARSQR
jgi:L-lactate dehydrogenase complex protein LldF